jgi:hypothetical protein
MELIYSSRVRFWMVIGVLLDSVRIHGIGYYISKTDPYEAIVDEIVIISLVKFDSIASITFGIIEGDICAFDNS